MCQVDDAALLNLVALLQLPIPLSKFSLSRLYLNLCLHPDTCALLLRCLLALLRAPIRNGATPGGALSNPLPYPSQVGPPPPVTVTVPGTAAVLAACCSLPEFPVSNASGHARGPSSAMGPPPGGVSAAPCPTPPRSACWV